MLGGWRGGNHVIQDGLHHLLVCRKLCVVFLYNDGFGQYIIQGGREIERRFSVDVSLAVCFVFQNEMLGFVDTHACLAIPINQENGRLFHGGQAIVHGSDIA